MVSAKDLVDVIDGLYQTRDVVSKGEFEEAVAQAGLGPEAVRIAQTLEPREYTKDELEMAVGGAIVAAR